MIPLLWYSIYCFCAFIIIGLIIASLFYRAKKKKYAILTIIISIIIYFAIFAWVYYEYESYENEITYDLKIRVNNTGEYTLYIPLLNNSELRSKINIRTGNGSIDYIDVNNISINGSNTAIKVVGNNDLAVYGKVRSNGQYSMSLTNNRSLSTYWVWCNKTNPNQNVSICIIAQVNAQTKIKYWETGEIGNSQYIFLENGWNEIDLDYSMAIA